MCRYAMYGPYKEKFACFYCRKMFRQTHPVELHHSMRKDAEGKRLALCPECRRPMKDMGLDFKPPRQSDVRQWKKVEVLFGLGYAYHSCGCSGPGPRPATLKDVPTFLEAQKQERAAWDRQQENWARAEERDAKRRKRKKERAEKRHRRLLREQEAS